MAGDRSSALGAFDIGIGVVDGSTLLTLESLLIAVCTVMDPGVV